MSGPAVKQAHVKFLKLDAVIVDQNQQEIARVALCLGMPAPCYPPGTMLGLDEHSIGGRFVEAGSEMCVKKVNPNGSCSLQPAKEDEFDFDTSPLDFDLKCDNHIYLNRCSYE
ncbi:unnamed protein product, partial [Polarella glacialis]